MHDDKPNVTVIYQSPSRPLPGPLAILGEMLAFALFLLIAGILLGGWL